MTTRFVSLAAALAVLALPLAAGAQTAGGAPMPSTTTEPASPATTSGPEGKDHKTRAAVEATLSPAETMKLRQYVTQEKTPSVKVTEKVAVGVTLPARVELYPLPAHLGVKGDYRYGVVNDHIVLVEAKTHKVTEIIN